MCRILSLHLARWSVNRILRRVPPTSGARPALLLATEVGGRRIVVGCCALAADAGVRSGMTVAQARALLSGLAIRIEPSEPDRDRRALFALGRWALRFTPIVAVDPPDGLLLDVRGCGRLFGGEGALVASLLQDLGELGLEAHAAVAGTIGCAWAVARYGDRADAFVPSGAERGALAPLPVASLRLEEETEDALFEIGIETVDDLFGLARDELPARFGEALVARLDQALGRAPEPLTRIRARLVPEASREFESPVRRLEGIELAARELLDELALELGRRGFGAWRVDVELVLVEAPPWRASVTLGRPRCDGRYLWQLLAPKLERARVEAGVLGVRLTVPRLGELATRQADPWDDGVFSRDSLAGDSLGELLDALDGRFGPERTSRVEVVESHLPERAFRLAPLRSGTASGATGSEDSLTRSDRPSVLFDPPESIDVPGDGTSPARVRMHGRDEGIVACIGPERIAAPWWETWDGTLVPGGTRDYFRVQSERGRWLWIYREAERWFLHGEWT